MQDDRRAVPSWRGRLRRSLALTADERRALYLVLALAVLGLLARYWHLKTRSSDAASRAVASTNMSVTAEP